MDMSASQCTSSGCESGWTLYLDQSSISKNQYHHHHHHIDNARLEDDEEEEEEDLSMVSDASSGPPHYSELDYGDYCFDPHNKKKIHKTKNKSKHTNQHQFSYLDDTASSHVFTKKEASMENVLEFSQGFSATHFKGKSSLKNHFGFFKSEKPLSKETGGYQGRKWK
ncbi:protein SOB FIVE-LIKE 5-like [Euphorbia lathyris]|uniref:protein SOB FIVE-LIKE 5-like n=1 Tax=Euphorbia lathyris TaxID=212925 RepID=UPI00331366CC